jgi:hypothetical protein
MKYFTPEFWLSWQDLNWKPPPPDKNPAELYRAQLDELRDRVSKEVFSFFSDWGYHELSDCGSGFLMHEVLFASGSRLLVQFRDVQVESVEVQRAAEQGHEPVET